MWLRRHRFARPVSFDYPHAFEAYWDRFGQTHPEFFALRPDGKREPLDDRHDLVQMCVSNPDLHKQIVADWLEQRAQNPKRPWINAAENDRRVEDPSCTCEACRAWDSRMTPGSLSDRYAKFWLAIQAEARKHDPEATVVAYAYSGYSLPPVETQMNDHILVSVVPPYAFPLPKARRKVFRALWNGWSRTGAGLSLRPNYFLDGYCMPYFIAEEFGAEFRYAWKHGLIGTDFDSLTGMWGAQGPNLYVLGRIHERPAMKVSAILDEYYDGFGPAAGAVRVYFEFWARVTAKMDDGFRTRAAGGWSPLSTAGDELYTPAAFRDGQALLDNAQRATAGNAEAFRRVQFLAVWLKHAELAIDALGAFHASRRAPTDAALQTAFAQARQDLDQYRHDNADALADMNLPLVSQLEIWSGWRPRPVAPPAP